jgi:hypothetical protein
MGCLRGGGGWKREGTDWGVGVRRCERDVGPSGGKGEWEWGMWAKDKGSGKGSKSHGHGSPPAPLTNRHSVENAGLAHEAREGGGGEAKHGSLHATAPGAADREQGSYKRLGVGMLETHQAKPHGNTPHPGEHPASTRTTLMT